MKKNKTFLIILSAALIVGAIGITTAATINYVSGESQNTQVQYRITFESNGGTNVKNAIYVNGDKTTIPVSRKDGYDFGGWYFDNETFEKPFVNGVSRLDKSITLYAKWVKKAIKVYLDTDVEGEFEPLIYGIGDTLHVSSLPTNVQPRNINGVNFQFNGWLDGSEKLVTEDFIIKDQYYSFHPQYIAPIPENNYELIYSNSFDEDCGYIDPEHSWDRGEFHIPLEGIGEGAPNQDIYVNDGNLIMRQLTYKGVRYGAKALLPYEFTKDNKNYSVSVEFKIDATVDGGYTSKTGDGGFGIMVGYNDKTGAYVSAVFDPGSKCVRICGTNKLYQSSGSDVNTLFSYDLPSNFDFKNTYHTLKVKYDGRVPTNASNKNSSYIYVYLDDVECWNTKDVTLNKNWFYEDQANGDHIGLNASLCSASIRKVSLKSYDEKDTIYSLDFSSRTNSLIDGWKYLPNCNGSSVGKVEVKNGILNMNTCFDNQSIKKNQTIYAPTSDELRNFVVELRFKFNKVSATDKYFSLAFRGDGSNKYSSIILRHGTGSISTYAHGKTSTAYSSWNDNVSLKTVAGGFGYDWHDLTVFVKDNFIMIYLDGKEQTSTFVSDQILWTEKGYVGLITSAADVDFDYINIYDMEKEAN